jgi:hypothetical protein
MDHSFTDGLVLATIIFGLMLGMAGLEFLVSVIQKSREVRKVRSRIRLWAQATKRRLQ